MYPTNTENSKKRQIRNYSNNNVHFNDECYFEDGQITHFRPVVMSK